MAGGQFKPRNGYPQFHKVWYIVTSGHGSFNDEINIEGVDYEFPSPDEMNDDEVDFYVEDSCSDNESSDSDV